MFSYFNCYVSCGSFTVYFTPTRNEPAGELNCTWPVFARALLLRTFLDKVINANVFHILLELLMDLEQSRTIIILIWY